MCGIVGFTKYNSHIDHEAVLGEMSSSLRHRGPDDEGFYMDPHIALGHRRLSIIDLSTGHQPIFNEDKSLCVILNGEIYNYRELREDLIAKGHVFSTQTDTEVIVHLYEEYEEQLVNHLNGMFAFALWDRNRDTLLLARDRSGKKPLYYTEINNNLIFASELKAILAYPLFKKEIDNHSLMKYLSHEYVPSPHTIFKGVKKLAAGHSLSYKMGKACIQKYWDYHFHQAEYQGLSKEEIYSELDRLIRNSVERRLMSDVPLGVFLSGGIDSSAIVAYMAELMDAKQIKTFTIGFDEKAYDESDFARSVARHFGTDHHEKILSPKVLIDILPEVVDFMDEPFADASVMPTYLLSRFTREKVTVALGGDGGDELFMGYQTFQANRLAQVYERIPLPIHRIMTYLAHKLPVSTHYMSFDFKVKRFLDGVHKDKQYREAHWLGAFSLDDLQTLVSGDRGISTSYKELYSEDIKYYQESDAQNDLDRLSYYYLKTFMTDQILVKVDRASMASSLEVRAPFLDVQVMDFVTSIPHKYKLKGLNTKYILKKILAQKLPKEIVKRPKRGFAIPVAQWLKGELKTLLLDQFSEDKVKREGYFNYSYIHRLMTDHFEGRQDHRKKLWTLLMFELWLSKWG